MVIDNWHQLQQADPTLSLVIASLQDGTLGGKQLKQINPPELSFCECETTSNYGEVSCIGEPDPCNLKSPFFSWFC